MTKDPCGVLEEEARSPAASTIRLTFNNGTDNFHLFSYKQMRDKHQNEKTQNVQTRRKRDVGATFAS